jgi:hypothetical protein
MSKEYKAKSKGLNLKPLGIQPGSGVAGLVDALNALTRPEGLGAPCKTIPQVDLAVQSLSSNGNDTKAYRCVTPRGNLYTCVGSNYYRGHGDTQHPDDRIGTLCNKTHHDKLEENITVKCVKHSGLCDCTRTASTRDAMNRQQVSRSNST